MRAAFDSCISVIWAWNLCSFLFNLLAMTSRFGFSGSFWRYVHFQPMYSFACSLTFSSSSLEELEEVEDELEELEGALEGALGGGFLDLWGVIFVPPVTFVQPLL